MIRVDGEGGVAGSRDGCAVDLHLLAAAGVHPVDAYRQVVGLIGRRDLGERGGDRRLDAGRLAPDRAAARPVRLDQRAVRRLARLEVVAPLVSTGAVVVGEGEVESDAGDREARRERRGQLVLEVAGRAPGGRPVPGDVHDRIRVGDRVRDGRRRAVGGVVEVPGGGDALGGEDALRGEGARRARGGVAERGPGDARGAEGYGHERQGQREAAPRPHPRGGSSDRQSRRSSNKASSSAGTRMKPRRPTLLPIEFVR